MCTAVCTVKQPAAGQGRAAAGEGHSLFHQLFCYFIELKAARYFRRAGILESDILSSAVAQAVKIAGRCTGPMFSGRVPIRDLSQLVRLRCGCQLKKMLLYLEERPSYCRDRSQPPLGIIRPAIADLQEIADPAGR